MNRINEEHEIGLVIVESMVAGKSLIERFKNRGPRSLVHLAGKKLYRRIQKPGHEPEYNRHFGDKWSSLGNEIKTLEVENINSPEAHRALADFQPDLILDHGTSLVKEHIAKAGKLILNLHWGLSPYYRGTHCTEWALINWDPYNIGVTIHKLTPDIDGGEILAQQRARIDSADTVNSINMQLTQMGTELLVDFISRVKGGYEPQFHSQDLSRGLLLMNRQWNYKLESHIERLIRSGGLALMLAKPARAEELPIIQM